MTELDEDNICWNKVREQVEIFVGQETNVSNIIVPANSLPFILLPRQINEVVETRPTYITQSLIPEMSAVSICWHGKVYNLGASIIFSLSKIYAYDVVLHVPASL